MADEDTGAAFGYYPRLKRGQFRDDTEEMRRQSANAPASALRGWLAGTLGLGGDVEGLVRMLLPGVSNQSYLPTSEQFTKALPLRSLQESPTARAFQALGTAAGGAGLGTAARVAESGAGALGRLAAEGVARGVERGSPLFAAAAPAYVVKPKGGQWLAGQPERITGPLMRDTAGRPVENALTYGYQAPMTPEATALNTWIEKKLGNYVRNEMATPEDPLRAMAEKWSTEKPALLAAAQAKVDALNAKTRQLMQERGVPEAYLTAHRQDVLAAEKARDLIAAREALHTQMPEDALDMGVTGYASLVGKRAMGGFPAKGMGQSPDAQAWEQLADQAVNVGTAGKRFGPGWGGGTLNENPWLAKVPPETLTYRAGDVGAYDLGFEHLADELRNALNPASGLPPELLMKYSDLPKKTLPDVVNRVADINAWRAAQKAEADLVNSTNAAVFTHKEYPEAGLAWKQIKAPAELSDELPKGYEIVKDARGFYAKDPNGNVVRSENFGGYADSEEAMRRELSSSHGPLAAALKYEGDTMRHCVGGYCPDVESGRSQIFSLRDERGRPHATIEVKPGPRIFDTGTPEGRPGPEKIHQIKGPGNKAPDEKYLPQIQDFVKSGQWSDVGDLSNAGLIKHPSGKYVSEAEANALAQRHFGESFGNKPDADEAAAQYYNRISRYNRDMLSDADNAFIKDWEAGNFAEGGSVSSVNSTAAYDPAKIHALAASLLEEMTNG